MRKLLIVLTMVSMLCLGVGVALADSTGNHGQPNQSCEDQPSAPGGQAEGSNPGSPFAGGVSDSHYAGTAPQNSRNPKSVSQYDVACFEVSKHR